MNYYVIILIIVIVGGISVTVWGAGGMVIKARQRHWPKTLGTISSCASVDDDMLPDVTFNYEVDGVTRSGRISFPSGTHPTEQLATKVENDHPIGSPVEVWYNPEKPDESLTGEGMRRGDLFITLIGIALTLTGIAALLQGLSK